MRRLSDWDKFKYFHPVSIIDNWGDPLKMDYKLIKILDEFRHRLKTPVIVTSGYRNWGATGSLHRVGKAVDIVTPKYQGNVLDLFIEAGRFDFTGIGLYDDWYFKNIRTGGLHLDVRDSEPARWIGHKNEQGANEYFPLNTTYLRRYKFI